MWKSWVSICCRWRGTSYMRPRESRRCMCAARCGWRSSSTAWKFVACNAGLWGGQSRPQAGFPARWTHWKGGPHPERLPHVAASPPLLRAIESRVAVSAGAACHSGGVEISHVLEAMQVPLEWARGTLRFSTGRMNTHKDIEDAVDAVACAVAEYRRG